MKYKLFLLVFTLLPFVSFAQDEDLEGDDDAITKVSESGKIIYSKSVAEIMLDNGLFGQVFGRYRF